MSDFDLDDTIKRLDRLDEWLLSINQRYERLKDTLANPCPACTNGVDFASCEGTDGCAEPMMMLAMAMDLLRDISAEIGTERLSADPVRSFADTVQEARSSFCPECGGLAKLVSMEAPLKVDGALAEQHPKLRATCGAGHFWRTG